MEDRSDAESRYSGCTGTACSHDPSVYSQNSAAGENLVTPAPPAWKKGLRLWRQSRKRTNAEDNAGQPSFRPPYPWILRHEMEGAIPRTLVAKSQPFVPAVAPEVSSISTSSDLYIAEDAPTFTGEYGARWGKPSNNASNHFCDQYLDKYIRDHFLPVRPRVFYKEMLPKQRPKSAQVPQHPLVSFGPRFKRGCSTDMSSSQPRRCVKKALPEQNQIFCRGMSNAEINVLPSAVLLENTLFKNCVIVCDRNFEPIRRSTKNTKPIRLALALREREITTLCVKDMWKPQVVNQFFRVIAFAVETEGKKPPDRKHLRRTGAQTIDPFNSVTEWMSRPPSHLSCLSLQRVLLRERGSQLLVDMVLNNPASRLQTIYCLHNELQDDGINEIIRAIKPTLNEETEQWILPNCLKSISLIQNRIRNDGAVALAKALERHKGITHLDISKNEIASEGGNKLAQMVRTNTTLTSLLLVDNPIHPDVSLHFSKALKAAAEGSCLEVVTGTAQNPRVSKRNLNQNEAVDGHATVDPTAAEAQPGPSLVDAVGTQDWRQLVQPDSLLWKLCSGEQQEPPHRSTHNISSVGRGTHKSRRDELVEAFHFNQEERINAIEAQRHKIKSDVENAFSATSRDAIRAGQILAEMKSTRAKLLAEIEQVERALRDGWGEKERALQAEAEWLSREIARREGKGWQGPVERYDNVLDMLYVKDLVIQPGQDIVSKPTEEFMEEISLVLEADEGFRKRQEAGRAGAAPKELAAPTFPDPAWKCGFHFEIAKSDPALHITSKHSTILLQDGTGTAKWKSAMLSPPIYPEGASSPRSPGSFKSGSNRSAASVSCGSFVEVRVMNCRDEKRCFVMLGLARGAQSLIGSHILDGRAGCALPCAVMFALHNGKLYQQGKAVGKLASRGAAERDRVGMWVSPDGREAKVYINGAEVGSIDVAEHLPPHRSAARALEAVSAAGAHCPEQSDAAARDRAEERADSALHFVVDLGIHGQELEIVSSPDAEGQT